MFTVKILHFIFAKCQNVFRVGFFLSNEVSFSSKDIVAELLSIINSTTQHQYNIFYGCRCYKCITIVLHKMLTAFRHIWDRFRPNFMFVTLVFRAFVRLYKTRPNIC